VLEPFLVRLLVNLMRRNSIHQNTRPGTEQPRRVPKRELVRGDTRCAEKTLQKRRLSISQSRRRKWDVVFEVKSFKYTLFVHILRDGIKAIARRDSNPNPGRPETLPFEFMP